MQPAVLVNHVVRGLLVAMVTLHILRPLYTQLSDLVVSNASSGFRINDLKQVSVSGQCAFFLRQFLFVPLKKGNIAYPVHDLKENYASQFALVSRYMCSMEQSSILKF